MASASRGSSGYGLNLTNYDEGHSGAISITYTLPLADIAVLKAGPTIGFQHAKDEDKDVQGALKLSLERYTPTSFGSTYVLADVSSVHDSWFVLGQMTIAPSNFGVELSRGGSDSYHEATLALQKRLAEGPFSLRLGYKLTSEEVFEGFSINTF